MMRAFADALRLLLREEVSNYTDDVSSGQCRTFEEYTRLCGLIQGLKLAENHLTDLANRMENSDG
mgnify:CR=1 FL=1